MFVAQCTLTNVTSGSISSTVERILWKCSDPGQTSKFTVTYTLNNKDQCNAPDDYLNLRNTVDCSPCTPDGPYSHYQDLVGLHPYSTYTYSVQAKVTTDSGDIDGTPTDGSTFTTDEAGECHAANVITMQN